MKAGCILHTPFDHNLSPTLDRPLGKPSLPQQWTDTWQGHKAWRQEGGKS